MDKNESFSEFLRNVEGWKFGIIKLQIDMLLNKRAYIFLKLGNGKNVYRFTIAEAEKGYEIFAPYTNPLLEGEEQMVAELAKLFLEQNHSQYNCFWCLKTISEKKEKIIGQKSFIDKERFSPTLLEDILLEIFTNQMVMDITVEETIEEKRYLLDYQAKLEKKISKSKLN